nr:MAG TPA: hypothetical protein [Caudoviricetes sp.]
MHIRVTFFIIALQFNNGHTKGQHHVHHKRR